MEGCRRRITSPGYILVVHIACYVARPSGIGSPPPALKRTAPAEDPQGGATYCHGGTHLCVLLTTVRGRCMRHVPCCVQGEGGVQGVFVSLHVIPPTFLPPLAQLPSPTLPYPVYPLFHPTGPPRSSTPVSPPTPSRSRSACKLMPRKLPMPLCLHHSPRPIPSVLRVKRADAWPPDGLRSRSLHTTFPRPKQCFAERSPIRVVYGSASATVW